MRIISPEKRLELLPFEPAMINASSTLPFLRLEDYRNLPPSDLHVEPMAYHIIAFHYKPPKGLLRHRCGGQWNETQMRQFDITYVPAYRDNQWQFDGENPNCLHILLHDKFIRDVIDTTWDIDSAQISIAAQFQSRLPIIKKLAFQFHSSVFNGFHHDGELLENLGWSLATNLLTAQTYLSLPHVTRGLEDGQFQRIVAYMQEHLDQQITLQEMASLLNLSTFHFSRMFRNTAHCSPYQYLINLRLEKAISLLSSQLSISQIALTTGFTDQSHFTRLLRKRYGLTPLAFRRQYVA